MSKKIKGLIIVAISVAFIVGAIVLITQEMVGYSILCFSFAAVCLFVGFGMVFNSTNPEKVYEKTVRDILNTYDSVLVKSNSVPNFEDRNIIQVMSIDDLIDAQLEIRKPICYMKQTESCSFALLDDREAYVYVEKLNQDVESPIEIEIKALKTRKKNEKEIDAEILKEIEKTTIVKLSNMKSYKISPVRQKKKQIEVLEWLDDPEDDIPRKNYKFKMVDSFDKDKEEKEEKKIIKSSKEVDVL